MHTTVFVKLLDEGIDVWKPIDAQPTESADEFILLDDKTHSDDILEFPIGSRVRVRLETHERKDVLVVIGTAT